MKEKSKLMNLIIYILHQKITENLRKYTVINLIKNYKLIILTALVVLV